MEPTTAAAAATVAAGGTVAAGKVAGASVAPVALVGILTDLLTKMPQLAGVIVVALMGFFFMGEQQERYDTLATMQAERIEEMSNEQTEVLRDLTNTLQAIELQTELLRAEIDELRDDVHETHR